jgi:isopenicillin N synthase-like dioxygenase
MPRTTSASSTSSATSAQQIDDLFAAARTSPPRGPSGIDNLNSPQFRGYTRVGYEHTGGRPDRRDQLDVGVERPALDVGPEDPAYLRLIGPNQWPDALPSLKPAVLAFQDEAERVSKEILAAFAVALGQDESYFATWFDAESTTSR